MGKKLTKTEVSRIAQEFEQLCKPLMGSNIFELLGIYGKELPISNYLSHLFDAERNHGAEMLFFEILLQLIVEKLPGKQKQVQYMLKDSYKVLREKNNIDILITEANDKWAIILENKVYHQLNNDFNRYIKSIDINNYLVVVLSLFNHPPNKIVSKDRYCCITYKELLLAFKANEKEINKVLSDETEAYLFKELFIYLQKLTNMNKFGKEEIALLTFYKENAISIKTISENQKKAEEIIISTTDEVMNEVFKFEKYKKGSFDEGMHFYCAEGFKVDYPKYSDQIRFYADYSLFFENNTIEIYIELYLNHVILYDDKLIKELLALDTTKKVKSDNVKEKYYAHLVHTSIKFKSFDVLKDTLKKELTKRFIDTGIFNTLINKLNLKASRIKQ